MPSSRTCAFIVMCITAILVGTVSPLKVKWTLRHARNSLDSVFNNNNNVDTRTVTRVTLSVSAVVSLFSWETLSKRHRRSQWLRRKKRDIDIMNELTYSILEYGMQDAPGAAQGSRTVLQMTSTSSSQETGTTKPQGSHSEDSSIFEKKGKSSSAAITVVVIVTVLLKLIGVVMFCKHVLVRYNKKRERQKREALERLQRSQNELMHSYIAANNQRHKRELEKTLSEISRPPEPKNTVQVDRIRHSWSVDKFPGSQLFSRLLNRAEAWRSLDGLVRLGSNITEETSPHKHSHSHESILQGCSSLLGPGERERHHQVFVCKDQTLPPKPQRRGSRGQLQPTPRKVSVDEPDIDCYPQVSIHKLKKPSGPKGVFPRRNSDTKEKCRLLTFEPFSKVKRYGILDTQHNIPMKPLEPIRAYGKSKQSSILSTYAQTAKNMAAVGSLKPKEQLIGRANESIARRFRRHSGPVQGHLAMCRDDRAKLGQKPYSPSCVVLEENDPEGTCHVSIETSGSQEHLVFLPSSSPAVLYVPPPPLNTLPRRMSAPLVSRCLSDRSMNVAYSPELV